MSIHEIDSFKGEVGRNRLDQEVEQAVHEANVQTIGSVTGAVDKDSFIRAAVTVSRLRAAYLKNVLALEVAVDGKVPDDAAIEALRHRREAYEEALQGFGALRHALKRGYFELA
ncbi:MAG: hypothetical protein QF893_24175 [Alphaproteobacteria bacterium]|jgi:hypothetical protein|nr:hypothetical protein [Alphaproteobacteria bacterium]